MKKIKCLLMAVLAVGFLVCMSSDVQAQSASMKKVDSKAVKAKVQNGKVAKFETRKATLSDRKIVATNKKAGQKVANLEAIKAKFGTNSKRHLKPNNVEVKALKKGQFKPTHQQKIENVIKNQ